MIAPFRPTCVFGICFLFLTGCSDDNGRVPVSGVVTLDGKPLPGVVVTFYRPDLPGKENIGWVGKTDDSGQYSLRPMTGEGSGAPPGKFQISLTTAVYDPSQPAPQTSSGRASTPFYPEEPPPPPEKIPPKYRVQEFVVPEDGTDEANFEVKSR